MYPIRANNRKAISVVMTTLIILVASVVLGTGVVLYGTSLFQTGGQTQSISSQGIKMWVNASSASNYAWGAAAIRNNGDVLASVNTITIRGATVPFSSWYADTNQTRIAPLIQAQFNMTKMDNNGNLRGSLSTGGIVFPVLSTGCTQLYANPPTLIVIDFDGKGPNYPACLAQLAGPITLNPGAAAIVFFKLPNSVLTPVDSGASVTVNIFAGNVGGPQTVTVANP